MWRFAVAALVLLLVSCRGEGEPDTPPATEREPPKLTDSLASQPQFETLTGQNPSKLADSFAYLPQFETLAEKLLDRIAAGDAAGIYERLGNEAFRKAASFEDVEKLVLLLGEKLDRPGPPALDFYKTNVLTEGIVAEGSFDVTWTNGAAKLHLRARKTDGPWLLEGFRVESALLR